MIGGKIIAITKGSDRWMLWCWDQRSSEDECGVFCAAEAEMPEIGDDIWWQDRAILWTPADRRFEDRNLRKIGYSDSSRETRDWNPDQRAGGEDGE